MYTYILIYLMLAIAGQTAEPNFWANPWVFRRALEFSGYKNVKIFNLYF